MGKLLLVLLLYTGGIIAQDSIALKKIIAFQERLNHEFASEEESPLPIDDLKRFEALDFFEIDLSYTINATFIRTPYESPFIMKTTTGREPVYVKYGEAHFTLKEKEYVLNIYQNQSLKLDPEYEDYLFLPFTDLSNGDSSYAGGRFIDMRIPKGESIVIDFNMAYNPYCAYNGRYSCPIPPEENHMDIEIPAGVKKYKSYPENK